MKLEIKSLRSFVGSKDFNVSRSFYRDLGFEEKVISDVLALFQSGEFAFYLSPSDVEDWINNTELFFVVKDVKQCFEQIKQLELKKKYAGIRIVPVKKKPWGEACYILDPSGIALCFAEFNQP
jgi:hypothetical protein